SARFEVERRLRSDDEPCLTGLQLLDLLAMLVEEGRDRHVLHARCCVALEALARALDRLTLGVGRELQRLNSLLLERAARARSLPLAFHRPLETRAIDRELPLAREILDEVDRHAERVIEPEHVFARDCPRGGG